MTTIRQAVLLAVVGMLAACAGTPEPIFSSMSPSLVWPAPPAEARIRYVGQLGSAADLKRPKGFFESVGGLLAGTDPPLAVLGPRWVVRTANGERLWVADPGGRCLHVFGLEDRQYQQISKVGPSRLLTPVSVCLGGDGSVFVCDSEDVEIHRLSGATGELLETLRLPREILRPTAVAYDEKDGTLYVVDVVDHNIKKLAADGRLTGVIGERGEAPGEFNFPTNIAINGGMLWVVDTGNHRIQGLTPDGKPVVTFGRQGNRPGHLALPKGIGFDSDGHIYVVDARFENVQVFDRSGKLLLFFGNEGVGPGQFWLPAGLFIDATDRIWICDTYNKRLQVFDYVKGQQ